uniref:Uncharacterized protein n=1 Tax=Noctiluca scintillans TaxID=2966 RepID=A0A7S1A964_NOCSC
MSSCARASSKTTTLDRAHDSPKWSDNSEEVATIGELRGGPWDLSDLDEESWTWLRAPAPGSATADVTGNGAGLVTREEPLTPAPLEYHTVPDSEPETEPFVVTLARVTHDAPREVAARMVDQLRHECLEEANTGATSWTGVLRFMEGDATFIGHVARHLAQQIDELGFLNVEWWNGKQWLESRGSRLFVLHDSMYDKHYSRVKVEWRKSSVGRPGSPRCAPVPNGMHAQSSSLDPGTEIPPLCHHMQELLDARRQLLEARLGEMAVAARRAQSARLHAETEKAAFEEELEALLNRMMEPPPSLPVASPEPLPAPHGEHYYTRL